MLLNKYFSLKKIKFDKLEITFILAGSIVLLFIVAPLIGLFLQTEGGDLFNAITDKETQNSIWLTLASSMAGVILFSVFAIPFSHFLARRNFPLKRLITSIIDLPVIIPHSAAGIALLSIISKKSLFGNFLDKLGIPIIGSPIGIAIAMAYVSIPFLINSSCDGFKSVPIKYEKAALSLGASGIRVFFTISIPLAWRSIVSGLIMMWARGLSEFGAVIIIAYYPMITPVLIFERFNSFGLKYSRPVTALFIMICLVVFIILRIIAGKKDDNNR